MGIIKETLKEAFENTKLELGVTRPDWIKECLPKIGMTFWWAFFVVWYFGVGIYLPIKLFKYGKEINSLPLVLGSVFIILIAFVFNMFLFNFTTKLHDKIMGKK